MASGKTLVVETKRSSSSDQYIQSVTFNGQPYDKLWFRHAEIAGGGSIVFTMESKPNPQFGSEPGRCPHHCKCEWQTRCLPAA